MPVSCLHMEKLKARRAKLSACLQRLEWGYLEGKCFFPYYLWKRYFPNMLHTGRLQVVLSRKISRTCLLCRKREKTAQTAWSSWSSWRKFISLQCVLWEVHLWFWLDHTRAEQKQQFKKGILQGHVPFSFTKRKFNRAKLKKLYVGEGDWSSVTWAFEWGVLAIIQKLSCCSGSERTKASKQACNKNSFLSKMLRIKIVFCPLHGIFTLTQSKNCVSDSKGHYPILLACVGWLGKSEWGFSYQRNCTASLMHDRRRAEFPCEGQGEAVEWSIKSAAKVSLWLVFNLSSFPQEFVRPLPRQGSQLARWIGSSCTFVLELVSSGSFWALIALIIDKDCN